MKIKEKNGLVKFFFGDGIAAVTLAPFGIYMDIEYLTNTDTINHESIHWQQQLEMGILPFYIWYFLEYFIRYITFQSQPYYNISMEREAYKNSSNPNYLQTRKPYSWFKYLIKK